MAAGGCVLNPLAKEFHLPAEVAPAARSLKQCRARKYRASVRYQCREVKQELLGGLLGADSTFWCFLCETWAPLRYARLDHAVPLRTLWQAFEETSPCEEPGGPAWKAYHAEKAILRVICKDCEISPS